jgi:hypothetical protein
MLMFKKIVLVLVAVLALIPAAQAASCYSPVEAEAEQGIRIHSELMVIGLNCQHMGKRAGQNLYNDYRQFTADHANLFAKYEEILMAYFKKSGQGNPEAALNTLRTNVANKISNDAAQMRPDVFCSRYAPRITQAKIMKETDVRKWAATTHPSHPTSKPLCAGG